MAIPAIHMHLGEDSTHIYKKIEKHLLLRKMWSSNDVFMHKRVSLFIVVMILLEDSALPASKGLYEKVFKIVGIKRNDVGQTQSA